MADINDYLDLEKGGGFVPFGNGNGFKNKGTNKRINKYVKPRAKYVPEPGQDPMHIAFNAFVDAYMKKHGF